MAPDPETQEMQLDQLRKERAARDAADGATEEQEAKTEERRAAKAAYLRERLEERGRSEDETD